MPTQRTPHMVMLTAPTSGLRRRRAGRKREQRARGAWPFSEVTRGRGRVLPARRLILRVGSIATRNVLAREEGRGGKAVRAVRRRDLQFASAMSVYHSVLDPAFGCLLFGPVAATGDEVEITGETPLAPEAANFRLSPEPAKSAAGGAASMKPAPAKGAAHQPASPDHPRRRPPPAPLP